MNDNQNPFKMFGENPAENLPPYEETKKKIEAMVTSAPIFIFMKGTPVMPQCGFSANTVNLFNQLNANYSSFNVLADYAVREGVKQYSSWPTIPQIYVNGEFIGGNDIVTEMFESGELKELVEKALS